MKARAEAELQKKGLTDRELKRGRGGIRDIEFAVQLLQLVHGRHDDDGPVARRRSTRSSSSRPPATSSAADGRRSATPTCSCAPSSTVSSCGTSSRPTRCRPTTPALVRLARVLGYRDSPRPTALEAFEADQRAHQAAVRSIHERLFFAPILDTLAGAGPLPLEAAEERLAAFGFVDATQHARRAPRAHAGAHPELARHAAAPAR